MKKAKKALWYILMPFGIIITLIFSMVWSIGHIVTLLADAVLEGVHICDGWLLSYKEAGWHRLGGGFYIHKEDDHG